MRGFLPIRRLLIRGNRQPVPPLLSRKNKLYQLVRGIHLVPGQLRRSDAYAQLPVDGQQQIHIIQGIQQPCLKKVHISLLQHDLIVTNLRKEFQDFFSHSIPLFRP